MAATFSSSSWPIIELFPGQMRYVVPRKPPVCLSVCHKQATFILSGFMTYLQFNATSCQESVLFGVRGGVQLVISNDPMFGVMHCSQIAPMRHHNQIPSRKATLLWLTHPSSNKLQLLVSAMSIFWLLIGVCSCRRRLDWTVNRELSGLGPSSPWPSNTVHALLAFLHHSICLSHAAFFWLVQKSVFFVKLQGTNANLVKRAKLAWVTTDTLIGNAAGWNNPEFSLSILPLAWRQQMDRCQETGDFEEL